MSAWLHRGPKLIVLAVVSGVLLMVLPIGNSYWRETLGVNGNISLTHATDTPAPPTPTPIIFGCTYTQGYWKNHPDAWPVDSIGIGSISLSKSGAIDVLKLPTRGDATLILAHQLIPAKLNVLIGANPIAIGDTIQQADTLLSQFPLGSSPQGGSRDSLIALSETLDMFNNGLLGPPHCDDNDEAAESPTETPAPEALPMLTEPTPVPLGAEAPSPTAVPVVVDSPTPTETTVAQDPTNTPEPPTAMPPEIVPTDTPVPIVPPTATALPALPPAPPPSGGEEPTPAPL